MIHILLNQLEKS